MLYYALVFLLIALVAAAFGFGGGGAQCLRDQVLRAAAYVTENLLVIQGRSAHFLDRGADGQGEVQAGINQRAVQIKDQSADAGKPARFTSHGIEYSRK